MHITATDYWYYWYYRICTVLPAYHAEAEDEAEVGHEYEEADQQQADAADDLVPGHGVEDEVLGVRLEQRMVT